MDVQVSLGMLALNSFLGGIPRSGIHGSHGNSFKNIYYYRVFVCAYCVFIGINAMKCVCRSTDNLVGLVLSYLYMILEHGTLVVLCP